MALFFKKYAWQALPWFNTIIGVLMTIHMGRQHNKVCAHIMNINDGIYESNASVDVKNRAHYLAGLCFVYHWYILVARK